MQKVIFFIALALASIFYANAQNKSFMIRQIDSLVAIKKDMVNDHDIKSFYTIQLFSGSIKSAEDTKKSYEEKEYPYKATIKYESPNYKVWVGMFRTKLKADKAYAELKIDYPNALVFRPGR